MPRGDGTGPMGMGPMTGRAAGYCAGYPTAGYMNPVGGRGFYGRGGGWGRRNWYYATGLPGYVRTAQGMPAFGGALPYTPPAAYAPPIAPGIGREQELQGLKAQSQGFQTALESIKKRIAELEAEGQSD